MFLYRNNETKAIGYIFLILRLYVNGYINGIYFHRMNFKCKCMMNY